MQFDLELVYICKGEFFVVWMYGYFFCIVCWYYYLEYEIYFVVVILGCFYVGDYIGDFVLGQLVMIGFNFLQNWIFDIGCDEVVFVCLLVIQFFE